MDWLPFLTVYSEDLLTTPKVISHVPEGVIRKRWMGYTGAADEQIRLVEERLGVKLPPSVVAFYQFSNGWRCAGYCEPMVFPMEILPIEKMDWFKNEYQEWIDAYSGLGLVADKDYFVYGQQQDSVKFRWEYLKTALIITSETQGGVYLLNPSIQFDNGEWEAWQFTNWMPGAIRYQSFWHLLNAEREMMHQLLEKEETEQ
jgi:hypothetical protein